MRSDFSILLIVMISILAIGIMVTAIGILTDYFSFLVPPSVDFFTMKGGCPHEVRLNCLIGRVELETGLSISGFGAMLLAMRFLYSRTKSS